MKEDLARIVCLNSTVILDQMTHTRNDMIDPIMCRKQILAFSCDLAELKMCVCQRN
jgi:hypothetical protein